MNIEVKGLDELDAHLQQMTLRVPGASMDSLRDSANHLLGVSVPRAPVDTGDLRGSGNVQQIKDGYEVRFSQRYAAIQHERLDFNHPRGGGPKYLEGPLLENRDRYLQHLVSSIRKEIE